MAKSKKSNSIMRLMTKQRLHTLLNIISLLGLIIQMVLVTEKESIHSADSGNTVVADTVRVIIFMAIQVVVFTNLHSINTDLAIILSQVAVGYLLWKTEYDLSPGIYISIALVTIPAILQMFLRIF